VQVQLRHWGDAVEPARKAASIDPSKKEAHLLLGTALLRSENYAGAASAFAKAVEMDPQDFQLNSSLGYAYYKAGDNAKAIPALEKALSIKPGDYTTTFTLGAAYVKEKECAKAEPVLEKAKTLQPAQADAIGSMIMGCYSSSGDSEKAVAEAKEKLAKDPKDTGALTFLAQSAMVAKEWDEAKEYYEALAKLQPKSGEPYYRIAQIQTMNKDYPSAIASYEKALSMEKKCEWSTGLGSVYQTMAVDIDNVINETLNEDPEARPDEAKLSEMMGHYDKAKEEYSIAVKACKSADAKKGLDSIKERQAAWQKYSEDAAKIEAGESIEPEEDPNAPVVEKKEPS